MRGLITLLFIIGMFLVTTGIYEQKVIDALAAKRVEYRFIPRTLYEEQMDATAVTNATQDMFRDAPLLNSERPAVIPPP